MSQIPKIIHYCWLSDDPYPQDIKSYIEEWKRLMPDWQFMLWDRKRFDIDSVPWCRQAFDRKKYAFAADYIRFYSLFHHGGVYLDSDVKVLKSFSPLLDNVSFLGYESCSAPEAAIIGSMAGVPWLGDCMEFYHTHDFVDDHGEMRMCPVPRLIKHVLQTRYGVKLLENGTIQSFEDGKIFPYYYFSPKSHYFPRIDVKPETFCIHNFNASWGKSASGKQKSKKKKINWGFRAHAAIIRLFGKRLHDRLFYYIWKWPYK